jgi:hypothetical protein
VGAEASLHLLGDRPSVWGRLEGVCPTAKLDAQGNVPMDTKKMTKLLGRAARNNRSYREPSRDDPMTTL